MSQAQKAVDVNHRNAEGLTPLLLLTRDVQMFEKLGDLVQHGFAPMEALAEIISHKGLACPSFCILCVI